MKRLIYSLIIALCISLAFSAGKPCCNKKAGKNTASCKFNQAKIEANKDVIGELDVKSTTTGDQKSYKCSNNGNQCKMSSKQPWWKFWAKKTINNCPCKQAQTVTTG